MTPFLRQVARHYADTPDLYFVFPSRRAQVFFLKYLSDDMKGAGRPVLAPQCCTIDEFVYYIAGAGKSDKVRLLLELYSCYSELYQEKNGKKAESLDEFIFWGDVILKDFSDVDRYLVNPDHIFKNVADYKKLSDDFTYLTPQQKEAMTLFLSRITPDKEMEANFLRVWDLLLPLYYKFRERLEASGLAYDGMVYRKAAEQTGRLPECSKFVFVGLNALDECEKTILSKLRDSGRAEFCWDFSWDILKDPMNKASLFLASNIRRFPQAFELDAEGLPEKNVDVIGVASGVAQSKQMYSILSELPAEFRDERTAIVLPDENMLVPVLNSIPEEIKNINVSMGYSIRGSSVFALMNGIAALQLHIRKKQDKWFFYHKQVFSIFSNSIFESAADDSLRERMKEISKERKYYIPESELTGHPLLELVFRVPEDYGTYLQEIIYNLAVRLKQTGGMALELDFAKHYYQAVTRLQENNLPEILPATYFRLLNQLVSLDTVPFRGEPLRGLQIMGPLETRAVDFDRVIILSCNEGIFPRHPSSTSFIPGELRHAFGLPDYEYHDAMNAYYFYRLLQRSGKVWMLYDSRMKNLRAGEESRYIKQLEMLYGDRVKVRRFTSKSDWKYVESSVDIPKTEEDIRKIKSVKISPSAMKDYRSCPVKFYYRVVKGIKVEDELSDSLDARTMGTVFHSVMQQLYSVPDHIVRADYLRSKWKDTQALSCMIDDTIRKELKTIEVQGRDIMYRELVLEYVRKCLQRDIEYLGKRGAGHFRILKLEEWGEASIGGFTFHGVIDRMDSVSDDEVRIVDYKTGKVNKDTQPDIDLQMYIYDRFLDKDRDYGGAQVVNSIYSPSGLFVSEVEDKPADDGFRNSVGQKLEADLAELADPEVPFVRKTNACKYCDFKTLCGK